MSDPMESAKMRGEAAVTKVAREVDANEMEIAGMSEIEKSIRHGYKFIDIIIRKDGIETRHEGDWIARLFRQPT